PAGAAGRTRAAAGGAADRGRAPPAAAAGRRALPVWPAIAPLPGGRAWLRAALLADLAAEVGAPLADALDRAARGSTAAAELHRAVAASVAGPAASARITLLLPSGCAVLGWAFGFDVPAAVLTPLGGSAMALALLLLAGARAWSGRLIRAAAAVRWERGMGLELAGLALRAGRPTSAAVLDAESAAAAGGVDATADLEAVGRLIAFAERSGAPLAALLDAEADRVRRGVLAEARLSASALAARLLLPLGALVLPAFLLAGALPIGLAVLSSTALPA
ncbi:MAG: hypothetical protein ACTHJL_08325, partial [Amnibacterium sp.]